MIASFPSYNICFLGSLVVFFSVTERLEGCEMRIRYRSSEPLCTHFEYKLTTKAKIHQKSVKNGNAEFSCKYDSNLKENKSWHSVNVEINYLLPITKLYQNLNSVRNKDLLLWKLQTRIQLP